MNRDIATEAWLKERGNADSLQGITPALIAAMPIENVEEGLRRLGLDPYQPLPEKIRKLISNSVSQIGDVKVASEIVNLSQSSTYHCGILPFLQRQDFNVICSAFWRQLKYWVLGSLSLGEWLKPLVKKVEMACVVTVVCVVVYTLCIQLRKEYKSPQIANKPKQENPPIRSSDLPGTKTDVPALITALKDSGQSLSFMISASDMDDDFAVTATVRDNSSPTGSASKGVPVTVTPRWTLAGSISAAQVFTSLNKDGGLFVGTSGGVFRSTDNGQSWTTANSGLTTLHVNALAVDGTQLLAGTSGGGIFRPTDEGQNWAACNNGLTPHGNALVISGTTLMMETSGGGVFCSIINGQDWTDCNNGLTALDACAFVVSKDQVESILGSQGFGWGINGNNGTNPATNFLGSINNVGLAIRTNNAERLRIDSLGNVGIGTATPGQRLDVIGNVRISGVGNGLIFPDGTKQTVAWLGLVSHDASLIGNGTSSSPLSVANQGIGTAQLANSAVTGTKIANGSVVRSLNGLFDNVTLAAGSNIAITPSGNVLVISATSGNSQIFDNGNVILDIPDNATIHFPDGTSPNRITLSIVNRSLTPVSLPERQFSSTIVQIAPTGATISPGAKLTFPNGDGFLAGAPVRLFRLDQRRGSPTLGQFIDVGPATVTSAGIETAANAVTETTIYFVSVPRTTITVVGNVVESEGQIPVQRALLGSRREMKNGKSNITFDYRIVAQRKEYENTRPAKRVRCVCRTDCSQ